MLMPMDRFLNLTYQFATENADETEREKFDIKLQMPVVRGGAVQQARTTDFADESPWSKQNEESALSGLVGALTGG